MKILIGGGALLFALALFFTSGILNSASDWPGVDEAVVKKFAEKGGREASDPIINTAKGDLALFFFLLAGTLGGFTAGYYYRETFPARTRDSAPEISA
jgi:hypothetical protein